MDGHCRRRPGDSGRCGAAGEAGDVLTMQAGCKHTILADTELQVIEVQIGAEISVDDKHKYEYRKD